MDDDARQLASTPTPYAGWLLMSGGGISDNWYFQGAWFAFCFLALAVVWASVGITAMTYLCVALAAFVCGVLWGRFVSERP